MSTNTENYLWQIDKLVDQVINKYEHEPVFNTTAIHNIMTCCYDIKNDIKKLRKEIEKEGDQKMYRCNDCYEIFDEPESERVDMEEYYGVGGLFGNHHHEYMSVCPFCNGTDFEEYLEDEEDE